MYRQPPDVYEQLHEAKDYEGEAAKLREVVGRWHPAARTLLDVACGTGSHLVWLRGAYECEGLDINEGLLGAAAEKLPGLALHHGDMEAFDLGRTFDVVTCLFGSIAFLDSTPRLTRAITAMAAHVAPGGLLIVEPWLTPEAFWPHTIKLDVSRRPERVIARMYVAEERDGVAVMRQHFLIGEPTGVTHIESTEREALHRTADVIDPMVAAGLEVVEHDPQGLHGYGLITARRP